MMEVMLLVVLMMLMVVVMVGKLLLLLVVMLLVMGRQAGCGEGCGGGGEEPAGYASGCRPLVFHIPAIYKINPLKLNFILLKLNAIRRSLTGSTPVL
jgi:hypothetical protein